MSKKFKVVFPQGHEKAGEEIFEEFIINSRGELFVWEPLCSYEAEYYTAESQYPFYEIVWED